MENSGKICWNLWRVEKFGKKCEKMTLFGKSLKTGKIWTNFEQYFLLRKKWKILEKSPGNCGEWKNLVKSVKKPCKIKNGKF